jgi:hypothetical protein
LIENDFKDILKDIANLQQTSDELNFKKRSLDFMRIWRSIGSSSSIRAIDVFSKFSKTKPLNGEIINKCFWHLNCCLNSAGQMIPSNLLIEIAVCAACFIQVSQRYVKDLTFCDEIRFLSGILIQMRAFISDDQKHLIIPDTTTVLPFGLRLLNYELGSTKLELNETLYSKEKVESLYNFLKVMIMTCHYD